MGLAGAIRAPVARDGDHLVGDSLVGERQRVRVLAQSGGGVRVSEPGLRLQHLAAADQKSRHAVSEPEECGGRVAGIIAEVGEAVAERLRAEPVPVGEV